MAQITLFLFSINISERRSTEGPDVLRKSSLLKKQYGNIQHNIETA